MQILQKTLTAIVIFFFLSTPCFTKNEKDKQDPLCTAYSKIDFNTLWEYRNEYNTKSLVTYINAVKYYLNNRIPIKCFDFKIIEDLDLYYSDIEYSPDNIIKEYFEQYYSKQTIKSYMDFLIEDAGSASESHGYYFADLYKINPELFYEQYKQYNADDRLELFHQLTFGLIGRYDDAYYKLFKNEIRKLKHDNYEAELAHMMKDLKRFFEAIKYNERQMELEKKIVNDNKSYRQCLQALITLNDGMKKYMNKYGKYTSNIDDLEEFIIPECQDNRYCGINIYEWMKSLPEPEMCSDINISILDNGLNYQILGKVANSNQSTICETKKGFQHRKCR